jgi:hypothetical protein
MKYWAYLHSNGSIQLKRYFGDKQDYTTDCQNNPFILKVIPPFDASNDDEALSIANKKLEYTPIKHQFRLGK